MAYPLKTHFSKLIHHRLRHLRIAALTKNIQRISEISYFQPPHAKFLSSQCSNLTVLTYRWTGTDEPRQKKKQLSFQANICCCASTTLLAFAILVSLTRVRKGSQTLALANSQGASQCQHDKSNHSFTSAVNTRLGLSLRLWREVLSSHTDRKGLQHPLTYSCPVHSPWLPLDKYQLAVRVSVSAPGSRTSLQLLRFPLVHIQHLTSWGSSGLLRGTASGWVHRWVLYRQHRFLSFLQVRMGSKMAKLSTWEV